MRFEVLPLSDPFALLSSRMLILEDASGEVPRLALVNTVQLLESVPIGQGHLSIFTEQQVAQHQVAHMLGRMLV